MTTVLRTFPTAKSKVSVSAVQLIPAAQSATLPLFALENDTTASTLFLRADDPNIYGVAYGNLNQVPIVAKKDENNVLRQKASNKGYNFYSAPWSIYTFPARDLGKRTKITAIDQSVYDYLTALYGLVGAVTITLTDWRLEKEGYVKTYQLLQGSAYVNVNGTTYFGAASLPNTEVSGVEQTSIVSSPLITNDFTYNGTNIPTIQMSYNTFCAIDTPITISAIDSSNPNPNTRIYFTLQNNVTMYNGPNYP
jgi:hypothetical protein